VCLATTSWVGEKGVPTCVCKILYASVIGRHTRTWQAHRHTGTHPTDEGASTARAIPLAQQQQRPSQQAWPTSKIRTTTNTTIPSHAIRPRTTHFPSSPSASTSNTTSRRDPHPRNSSRVHSQRPLFGLGMSGCSPCPLRGRNSVFASLSLCLCALCSVLSALCNVLYAVCIRRITASAYYSIPAYADPQPLRHPPTSGILA
jgi:hypothetical protein